MQVEFAKKVATWFVRAVRGFAAIAGWADSDAYPVSFMCAWLGVSRSGCYAWRAASRPAARDDSALIAVIEEDLRPGAGNPGVRRMRAAWRRWATWCRTGVSAG